MQILRLLMGHTKIAFSQVVLTQHLVVYSTVTGDNCLGQPSFTWPLSIIYDNQFQTKKMYLKTYESIIVL